MRKTLIQIGWLLLPDMLLVCFVPMTICLAGKVFFGIPTQQEKQEITSNIFYQPAPSFSASQRDGSAEIWLDQLYRFNDDELTAHAQSKKYLNLMLAATALSAESKESWEQLYWSGLAVSYGQIALKADTEPGQAIWNEINARLLVAMALNYYQGGMVDEAMLKTQFEQTDPDFLFGSGFCKYSVLQALHEDGLIEMPVFPAEKII